VEHCFHGLEPTGHTFAQEQGQADTARLVGDVSPRYVPCGASNLGAKLFVLQGELCGIELCGDNGQRRFFSACK
jgi:hypothetical protein